MLRMCALVSRGFPKKADFTAELNPDVIAAAVVSFPEMALWSELVYESELGSLSPPTARDSSSKLKWEYEEEAIGRAVATVFAIAFAAIAALDET